MKKNCGVQVLFNSIFSDLAMLFGNSHGKNNLICQNNTFRKGDEIVVKSSGKFRMRWHAIPREKLDIP